MPHPFWECFPREWPWQKKLNSLTKYSYFVFASIVPNINLSLLYSFTLSFYLPSSLPLLLRLSVSPTFINSSLFILSLWPDHLSAFLFTYSVNAHFICISSHAASFIHAFMTTLTELIYTACTLNCCALFHNQFSDPHVSVG